MIDKESVQQLEARLKQTRTSCGENALYFAGMFLWHTGRHDKAREYVDRMLKMSSGSKEVRVVGENNMLKVFLNCLCRHVLFSHFCILWTSLKKIT